MHESRGFKVKKIKYRNWIIRGIMMFNFKKLILSVLCGGLLLSGSTSQAMIKAMKRHPIITLVTAASLGALCWSTFTLRSRACEREERNQKSKLACAHANGYRDGYESKKTEEGKRWEDFDFSCSTKTIREKKLRELGYKPHEESWIDDSTLEFVQQAAGVTGLTGGGFLWLVSKDPYF